ncbi:MAG: signal peptidase II [Candidatus Hinthialibacter antarcticus]|nr:signal peptidase II [Candidatus Hinthialibacter antarcticus]
MTESQPTMMQNQDRRRDLIWVAVIAVVIFALDQISKYWAVMRLKNARPIVIIEDVFQFAYGENTGIAFGMFQNHGGWLHVVTPIAFAVLIYLIYKQFAESTMDVMYRLVFALLIGGALGNIIDRIRMGYVVDFIDVFIGTYNFPTFNIADSALTCGQILLILKILFWETHPQDDTEPNVAACPKPQDDASPSGPPCTPS